MTAFVSLSMVALILLVGCAPRATSGETAAAADESQIVVDLPAIVLDVQSDGTLAIGGQKVSELGGGIGPTLATLSFPPDMVANLIGYNIQHVQVDNTPEGLLILVNGQPVPSLAWDGEKLVATAEVLDTLGSGVAMLDKALPLLTNLGLGAIIRFPLAEGEEALPMVAPESEEAAAAVRAQQEFLDAVGDPPVLHFTIEYADDGTWSIAEMAQSDLASLLPVPLDMLNLTPATVQSIVGAGITEIGLNTNQDGIFISLNGKTLPYLTWADGRVSHLIQLAKDTGLLSQALGDNPDVEGVIEMIEAVLPAIQATDVGLKVVFPSS